MKFYMHDILSALIPGFLLLGAWIYASSHIVGEGTVDAVIATVAAFVLGYIVNAVSSSWLERVYYWSWRGKPSDRMLQGKGVGKIKFREWEIVKEKLMEECRKKCGINDPTDGDLFSVAYRHAFRVDRSNSRVAEFNSKYVFSRNLFTVVIFALLISGLYGYCPIWWYYPALLIVGVVIWFRAKQEAYYFVKEVLNEYFMKT